MIVRPWQHHVLRGCPENAGEEIEDVEAVLLGELGDLSVYRAVRDTRTTVCLEAHGQLGKDHQQHLDVMLGGHLPDIGEASTTLCQFFSPGACRYA